MSMHPRSIVGQQQITFALEDHPLGKGTFGVVYAATDESRVTEHNKKYAVKLIPRKQDAQKDKQLTAFTREIDLMRAADQHPHVVSVKDFAVLDDYLCVVMDLASGGDLFDLVCERANRPPDAQLTAGLSELESKFYTRQLVDCLSWIHAQGLSHRDIKPENLLLDESQQTLLLTDFGFAKILQSPSGNEILCSTPLGTPKFMAPEMLHAISSGESYSGSAVDCWAAGVVVFVMVAANFPWTLASPLAIVEAGQQQPPSLEYAEHAAGRWKMPSGFTPNLVDFLQCACAIDPSQRWSAQQLMEHPWLTAPEADAGLNADLELDYSELEESHQQQQLEYLSAQVEAEEPASAAASTKRKRHNRSGERIFVIEAADVSVSALRERIDLLLTQDEAQRFECAAAAEEPALVVGYMDPQRGYAQVKLLLGPQSDHTRHTQVTYQKCAGDQLAFHFLVDRINGVLSRLMHNS